MRWPEARLHLQGLPTRVRIGLALRWWERARGLLFHGPLKEAPAGLWIAPCNSVHMLGMRQALDVVYLDKAGHILKCVPGLRPWRMSACPGAHVALELRAGLIAELGLKPGLRLMARLV